jgi:RNA-directed DNA polymerase
VAAPPLLLTRDDVANLLALPLNKVTWWLYALREDRRYTRIELAKRTGSQPREIHAPIKPIKDMQRTLATVLAGCYEPPVNVHGFVPGRSPVSNARQHQQQKWILKVDLENFFPSINFGRVRGMFMAFPFEYPADVATLLAQLCCYRNQLPQGAPTSPIVSNFICRRLDVQLAKIARDERCYYTRYADDICLSTNRKAFPAGLASRDVGNVLLGAPVTEAIRENGFRVNLSKTRLIRHTRRQRVTGLVVNEKVNVDRDYVRSLRNLLYVWRRYGEEKARESFQKANFPVNRPPEKPPARFNLVIQGRVQHVGSVKGWTNRVYRSLAHSLYELDDTFRPRTSLTLESAQQVHLYTEGKSDLLHILAARAYFNGRNEFSDIELVVLADSDAGNDVQLLAKCQGLALTEQQVPCVCVFDRDNDALLPDAVGGGDSRHHGNRVIALAIKAPEWRGPKVCIEMLYRDDDLARRDAAGRRLYLAEEFHPRTGQHRSEQVHVTNPRRTTLVREEVFKYGTETNVALGKAAFAKYVHDRESPFDQVDFEGFRPTFEALQAAVARVVSSP